MKKNDKEFEEIRDAFEIALKLMPVYVGSREREARDSKAYYQDGTVNAMFISFMSGYQYAKGLARLGSLTITE